MGYTTDFTGSIEVTPPLSQEEISYINKFNQTRRMKRKNGPYFVDGTESLGQGHDADVIDFNRPSEGQPGLWCQWIATSDGKFIRWDGSEKFYNADVWMAYLINHFLGKTPIAKNENKDQFYFLQGHTLNGEIQAQGEDEDDKWTLIVKNNIVQVIDN